jgi:hypothetical protein
MMKTFLFLIAIFACAQVSAQTSNDTTRNQNQSAPSAPASDDISITATVTARELRFERVPNPRVEFTGTHERITVWEAERTNLPRPVEPGVTYRNIGIQLRISSVFADIDRIVAEALGEIPVTDDAPPQTPSQSHQMPVSPPASSQSPPPPPSSNERRP